MQTEFNDAAIEQEGPWFIAYCKEVPGANGQGKTREECLTSLHEAIQLMQSFHSEESEKHPASPAPASP